MVRKRRRRKRKKEKRMTGTASAPPQAFLKRVTLSPSALDVVVSWAEALAELWRRLEKNDVELYRAYLQRAKEIRLSASDSGDEKSADANKVTTEVDDEEEDDRDESEEEKDGEDDPRSAEDDAEGSDPGDNNAGDGLAPSVKKRGAKEPASSALEQLRLLRPEKAILRGPLYDCLHGPGTASAASSSSWPGWRLWSSSGSRS